MTQIVVRPPEDEDERLRFERILEESFGNEELAWSLWMQRIANLRVLFEDGAMRGGLGFYRFAQFWGGSSVPMIGLAGVGVVPQARGRGIAKRFLLDTLREARAEGTPLAALYASTLSVYRAIGFEPAGSALKMSAPIASLPPGDTALECEPFSSDILSSDDGASLHALYLARARSWNGHLDRSPAIWARIAKPYKGIARGYRFGPASAPEGYVVYMHAPEGATLHFGVTLRDLVLTTPRAARRCTALFSGLRSLGDNLSWLGCASDPLLAMLPEETTTITDHSRWLLRILDPVRALAQRGYATDGEAAIDVHDPDFGDVGVTVRVRDGRAEVQARPFGRAAASIHVRGLAALYSGFAHPTTLVAAGLASGDLAALSALSRLFQSGEPWLCDWF